MLVIFLGTSAKLLNKSASLRISTYALIMLTLLGGVAVSLIVLALDPPTSFAIASSFWLPLLGVTVLWTIASAINYVGIREAPISVRESLVQSRMIFIPIIAVFFLGEHFSLLDAFGTVLVIAGILTASYRHSVGFRHADTKGAEYVLVASVLIAIAASCDKYFSSRIDAAYYAFFLYFGGFLLQLLFLNRERCNELITFFHHKRTALITLAGVFLGGFFYLGQLWLYKHVDLHIAYPIIQLPSAFALVLAIIFFNERERMWLKITGFCIAALGAIVLRIAA